jgi:hypothetical protein
MKQKDVTILCEVVDLMRKCPAISPNPYEISGTIHACRDFQKVNSLASTIIEKYAIWSANRHRLSDPDFDGAEYIEICGAIYQEKLQELRDFIEKRSAENWK